MPLPTDDTPGFAYTGECLHPLKERSDGGYRGYTHKRWPLVYGSAQVELCCACGGWRLTGRGREEEWHAGPYKVARDMALAEDDR
jgi:hypothetical protein